jgi:hypothetical protein
MASRRAAGAVHPGFGVDVWLWQGTDRAAALEARPGGYAERREAINAPKPRHVSNSNNSNAYAIEPAKIVAKCLRF